MLDIIIPTYKNKKGLARTLHSINTSLLDSITVTVIDDFSEMEYEDIIKEFPFISIYYNKENVGPGLARQHGMEITHEPYITFIDTDDYFISNEALEIMLNTIKENPDIVSFMWQYQYENSDKKSDISSNRMHGRVYKRSFLQEYNISFCPESSRINEDIGFNRLCRLILGAKNYPMIMSEKPVIIYTKNENSITHYNNNEFFYKQQNKGLALNIIHAIKIAKQNNLPEEILMEEIDFIMCGMYYTFLCTQHERPEFLQEAWEGAKIFYDTCFAPYEKINEEALIVSAYKKFIPRIMSRAKHWAHFKRLNLNQFLNDLKNYKEPPSRYVIS